MRPSTAMSAAQLLQTTRALPAGPTFGEKRYVHQATARPAPEPESQRFRRAKTSKSGRFTSWHSGRARSGSPRTTGKHQGQHDPSRIPARPLRNSLCRHRRKHLKQFAKVAPEHPTKMPKLRWRSRNRLQMTSAVTRAASQGAVAKEIGTIHTIQAKKAGSSSWAALESLVVTIVAADPARRDNNRISRRARNGSSVPRALRRASTLQSDTQVYLPCR